jgi:hypothetical protein
MGFEGFLAQCLETSPGGQGCGSGVEVESRVVLWYATR